jgi:hypothetical protein
MRRYQRNVSRLVSGRQLISFGASRSRTLKLTDAGEAHARALCGLPSFADALVYLAKIVNPDRFYEPHGSAGARYVAEVDLAGLDQSWAGLGANDADAKARRQELRWLEITLSPLLLRGWIESAPTTSGRAFYVATDAGRQATAPATSARLPSAEDAAFEWYWQVRNRAFDELNTLTAYCAEIGAIPLPASHGAAKHDPQGVKVRVD